MVRQTVLRIPPPDIPLMPVRPSIRAQCIVCTVMHAAPPQMASLACFRCCTALSGFDRILCLPLCLPLLDPGRFGVFGNSSRNVVLLQNTKAYINSLSGVTKSLFVRTAENMNPQNKIVRIYCNHQVDLSL